MDRIEERALEFHAKVRQGFLELAKEESQRFRVIQTANRSREEVAAIIWEAGAASLKGI